MADDVGEALNLLVGAANLLGAGLDRRLQTLVGAAQLAAGGAEFGQGPADEGEGDQRQNADAHHRDQIGDREPLAVADRLLLLRLQFRRFTLNDDAQDATDLERKVPRLITLNEPNSLGFLAGAGKGDRLVHVLEALRQHGSERGDGGLLDGIVGGGAGQSVERGGPVQLALLVGLQELRVVAEQKAALPRLRFAKRDVDLQRFASSEVGGVDAARVGLNLFGQPERSAPNREQGQKAQSHKREDGSAEGQ